MIAKHGSLNDLTTNLKLLTSTCFSSVRKFHFKEFLNLVRAIFSGIILSVPYWFTTNSRRMRPDCVSFVGLEYAKIRKDL